MDQVSESELAALEEERAFLDRSAWRKVRVTGGDAVTWLGDLLTADIAGLEPGAGVSLAAAHPDRPDPRRRAGRPS